MSQSITKQPVPAQPPTPLTEAERLAVKDRLLAARVSLILGHTFFSQLIIRLKMVEDDTILTACTDGTVIRYNPAYIKTLTYQKIEGVNAHEVLHCVAGHLWRIQDLPYPPLPKNTPASLSTSEIDKLKTLLRHDKANRAADYAINPIVTDMGLQLPDEALLDKQYSGMALEGIYHILPDPEVEFIESGGFSVKGQPRCGDMTPDTAKSEAQQVEERNEWQTAAVRAAQAARDQGKLPSSLEKFLHELQKPRVDWKALLRRFVQEATKSDYSWAQPNKRFMPAGLYLPRLHSKELGPIVVAQDTSGSMWNDKDLQACASELRGIIEDCRPSKTTLYYADAQVASTREFERGEPFEFAPKGGGGTSFVPVFEAIEKSEEEPLCLIYFTDLQGTFPPEAPPYPVIWLSIAEGTAPFGDVLTIELFNERET